jgi:hypothetical protein
MDPATFWTAIGAIATCVAAAAAVFANRSMKKRPKYIRLEGRLKGDLGDEWNFLSDLRVNDSTASGRIHWTLIECPPSLPWAKKVGEKGYELVEGTLEQGILSLIGKKIAEGNEEFLGLSDYTIPLPSRGNSFEGQSRPQKRGKWYEKGKLQGTVTFLTNVPPHFQE